MDSHEALGSKRQGIVLELGKKLRKFSDAWHEDV